MIWVASSHETRTMPPCPRAHLYSWESSGSLVMDAQASTGSPNSASLSRHASSRTERT